MNETLRYRRTLCDRELKDAKSSVVNLQDETVKLKSEININDNRLKQSVLDTLKDILAHEDNICRVVTIKKLNNLYNEYPRTLTEENQQLFIKEEKYSFLNLSDHNLTKNEQEFLDLGLNCHLLPKYSKLQKQTEIEVLYQKLIQLQKSDEITIKEGLADQLRSESGKHRNGTNSQLLSPQLRIAANNLRDNPNIMIRKADKSSSYVLLNGN